MSEVASANVFWTTPEGDHVGATVYSFQAGSGVVQMSVSAGGCAVDVRRIPAQEAKRLALALIDMAELAAPEAA
jgi:hypothetical protein